MKDYKKELSELIQAKKEEARLPETIQTVFQDVDAYHAYKKRTMALHDALDTLKEENLPIDARCLTQLTAFEEELERLAQTIQTHISWLLTALTPKKWFTLMSLLEKNETKEHLQVLLDAFNENQKEMFYHTVRQLSPTPDERVLLHRFEERLAYSYAFLRAVQRSIEDAELLPFEDFFEKYVPVYHQKIASTLRWLKNDVFSMDLSEVLLERYAQSTVRRLEIGETIANPKEKKQFIQKATTEFTELLRTQQQKKSSK